MDTPSQTSFTLLAEPRWYRWARFLTFGLWPPRPDYTGHQVEINGQVRTIVHYDGTTKVATLRGWSEAP